MLISDQDGPKEGTPFLSKMRERRFWRLNHVDTGRRAPVVGVIVAIAREVFGRFISARDVFDKQ